jgi:hypothetical protein
MEKDKHISKLFRESGVVHAPEGFTKSVMDRIEAEPVRKAYKPLIGKSGRILVVLFIVAIVVVSLLYSTPAGSAGGPVERFFSQEWQLPSLNLKLDFFENLQLQPWLIATIVALFLLVLSDAGLRRRNIF